MAKKYMKPEEKPKKIVSTVRYFVFKMSDEGHLSTPKYNDYGSVCDCFDTYDGYESIEGANQAIVKYHEKDTRFYGEKYVILPIAKVKSEDV